MAVGVTIIVEALPTSLDKVNMAEVCTNET